MKNLFCFIYFLPIFIFAQDKIEGIIMSPSSDGTQLSVSGANVIWKGTSIGTISDLDGNFTLPYNTSYKQLIISYIGYKTVTIDVDGSSDFIKVILLPTDDLSEVTIDIKEDPSRIRPLDVPELRCDSSKFRKETGWLPEIDFRTTLSDLLKYWREKLKND